MKNERRESVQQLPYCHSFERYFEFNGETVDRLALILEHGLLSPEAAEEKGIPYKRLPFQVTGIQGYYDVIFLHSTQQRMGMPKLGNVVLYFGTLSVFTYEEMQKNNPGWFVASIGEVYAKGQIPPTEIKRIKLMGGNKEDVLSMVKKFGLNVEII